MVNRQKSLADIHGSIVAPPDAAAWPPADGRL